MYKNYVIEFILCLIAHLSSYFSLYFSKHLMHGTFTCNQNFIVMSYVCAKKMIYTCNGNFIVILMFVQRKNDLYL
jgi:hypothetical protein